PIFATIDDLRRTLVLLEWRDEDADDKLAAVDQANRALAATRFGEGVRAILRQGDPHSRFAILNMLADMGSSVRGAEGHTSLAREIGPDLAQLVVRGQPGERAAAAQALGLVNPDAEIAVPALATLLTSK